MRVFLTHDPEDLDAYYGRSLPDLESIADVVRNPLGRELSTQELIEASSGCDVIVAHRSTPGEAALFDAHGDVVAFLRCAVDISTIDVDAASRHGVLVARADKSFVASTAELALGLLLDAARHIASSTADYRQGIDPPQRRGRQLAGRTAGIIGYGAIGSHLAALLGALGMRVVVHDPFVAVPPELEVGTLGELLALSDAVFPLAQAAPETENLIGAAELDAMRPDALLVNVSRGELLDEDAVAAALDDGRIGGVALDVGRAGDQRPSPALAARSDVVATPHLGGLTPENADAQAASSVEQVRAMLDGELPPRTVNPDSAARFRARFAR